MQFSHHRKYSSTGTFCYIVKEREHQICESSCTRHRISPTGKDMAKVKELWYVEEYDVLALALNGKMKHWCQPPKPSVERVTAKSIYVVSPPQDECSPILTFLEPSIAQLRWQGVLCPCGDRVAEVWRIQEKVMVRRAVYHYDRCQVSSGSAVLYAVEAS
ncbi:hypothetical protein Gotri_008348 [Gossypium trilobum]|uniref:Uncharacterized protein n=1 Tax=Gossypium trilobum TaxID=34281 RepID=A0A7J9EKP1_9ROSI|nr:hypothetical protein [Gossypium trilobum]